MFLGFFIHNITSIYHFLWLPYLQMLYFQSFILLSQPCQNWLTLHTPSKLYEERWPCSPWGHIKQSVPQFKSGSCNCGNHSVIVFSFTTTQSKIKKETHWAEAHLKFYFGLPIYISINCPDIFGKFCTGFALPCNPWEGLVSNNPLQYHPLIKNLGQTDKANDHGWKVLIVKKIINYHRQHLNRKCMGNSMEKVLTVWCNQLGVKG